MWMLKGCRNEACNVPTSCSMWNHSTLPSKKILLLIITYLMPPLPFSLSSSSPSSSSALSSSSLQWTKTATTSVQHLSHREKKGERSVSPPLSPASSSTQASSPPSLPPSSPQSSPSFLPPPFLPRPPSSPGRWILQYRLQDPGLFGALLYAEQHGSGGGTLEAAVKRRLLLLLLL